MKKGNLKIILSVIAVCVISLAVIIPVSIVKANAANKITIEYFENDQKITRNLNDEIFLFKTDTDGITEYRGYHIKEIKNGKVYYDYIFIYNGINLVFSTNASVDIINENKLFRILENKVIIEIKEENTEIVFIGK